MLRKLLGWLTPLVFLVSTASAADLTESLKKGNVDLKSAGPLCFGPDGVLFAADPMTASVFAIDTQDRKGAVKPLNVTGLDKKVAALLGTSPDQINVVDLAANPASGNLYMSVSRGRGPDAAAVLLKLGSNGSLTEVGLSGVKFAKAELPNAAENRVVGSGRRRRNKRVESITDLMYTDGRLFVAGLSNEEFASNLRSIPFPFKKTDRGTSVEIYHGAHGAFETRSPIRTFAPFDIDGEPHVLAAYTCTPLVKFPISKLKAGQKLMGTTIAELGNRNRPLDMFVYGENGEYILMANSSRGVMKISTTGVDIDKGITKRVGGGGTAGLKYDTVEELSGVNQLDRLGEAHAVVLRRSESGSLDLQTVELP